MLTLSVLQSLGANTEEGLTRCMNNEAFYLRLAGMALADQQFDSLRSALEQKDAAAAFQCAHALKGVLGNLSLTPLFEPASRLTELLRGKNAGDPLPPEAEAAGASLFAALEPFRAAL